MTDAERKKLNAKAMADEVFSALCRVSSLQDYIDAKCTRYADEPEFWERIKALGISSWLEKSRRKPDERSDNLIAEKSNGITGAKRNG